MLKLITFLENLKAEPRRLTDEENLYLDQIGDELRRAESDAARWRILEREASWLPPWRELLREYQRLEARGEIRGGRFLSGVVGQQFALPEAVAALRSVRKRAHDGAMIVVSAADPLNLLGGIVAGDKVPRQPGARLLWRDGLPLASLVAGEFKPLPGLAASEEHAVRMALLRDPAAQAGPLQAAGSRPQADPLGLHR